MLWILHFFFNVIKYSYIQFLSSTELFFKLSNFIIRLKKIPHMTDELNTSSDTTSLVNFFPKIKKIKKISFYKLIKIKQIFLNNLEKVKIKTKFKLITMQNWKINFLPTSVNKYTTGNCNLTTIYYLRKNRIFNKSRYSRNRQLYRTGVYWCLWLSIFVGWGLYFIFYRFTLNFGYLWWLTYLGLGSFYFNRLVKYRFYNLMILWIEFKKNYMWAMHFFSNFNFFKK